MNPTRKIGDTVSLQGKPGKKIAAFCFNRSSEMDVGPQLLSPGTKAVLVQPNGFGSVPGNPVFSSHATKGHPYVVVQLACGAHLSIPSAAVD